MNLTDKCKASGQFFPRRVGPLFWASCAALVLWLSATGAEAHSVYIFAFPENSQICTNSYFGAKNKVRGGLVSMAAASGEVLATAQTDEQGNACFAPPESRQDLIFTVEAGEGHRAEFRLPAAEMESVLASGPVSQKEQIDHGDPVITASSGGLTREDLRQALSPIMRKLAEIESTQNSRVNLKDIIGGLGWLIGLAGAGLWAASRKNETRGKS
jgi:nickel transport protein